MEERRRRGKQTRKKSHKKKKIGFGTILLFILLGIIVIGLGSVGTVTYTQVVAPIKEVKEESLTFITVGTDTNAYREELWADGDKATLTDSIMVWTFNPNTMQVVTTSIPRDTSVDYMCPDNPGVPDYQDQINELYYLSGNDISCLEETVENLLQVPIDYYMMVNMDALEEIINLVGPITITAHAADGVLYQENVSGTMSYQWVDGQTYEMDGDEALTYARARHDSEKDYGRGIRQQQVIASTLKTTFDSGVSKELINQLFALVDTNMQVGAMYQYAKFGNDINTFLTQMQYEETLTKDTFTDTVWLNLFEAAGYDKKNVTQETLNGFQEFIYQNYTQQDLKNYFVTSKQFFNEAYSGHYNIVSDQLQDISNALRANLGLEPIQTQVPSKPYGDNEGSGLIPTEWATQY